MTQGPPRPLPFSRLFLMRSAIFCGKLLKPPPPFGPCSFPPAGLGKHGVSIVREKEHGPKEGGGLQEFPQKIALRGRKRREKGRGRGGASSFSLTTETQFPQGQPEEMNMDRRKEGAS